MAAVKIWSLLSAIGLAGSAALLSGKAGDRTLLQPGATSDGHHQLELACEECHGKPFAGADALEAACRRCHGPQLDAAEDTHPSRIFRDPRNAERLGRVDARRCVTCHREHWPEGTRALGVTVAEDHCAYCHDEIAHERPSHAGLDAASCDDTGCHKYHDNRSTYEEFLLAHAEEAPRGSRPQRASEPAAPKPARHAPLSAADADAPAAVALDTAELTAWAESAHARAGVNCKSCHARDGAWTNAVPVEACGRCHADERAGWVSGKHGLRVGLGLAPMRPELARLPMQPSARGKELDCSSCHGAHRFDRRAAAAGACLHCHADGHSQAYAASPHARAFRAELAGEAPEGSGVSCATCHLPKVPGPSGQLRVLHDQNENLRPREKMIRSVCLDCHGLAFSIDALADEALIDSNFADAPERHVPSIDWALTRRPPPQRTRPEDEHDPPTSPP